ncbi:MAG: hypothetical protein ACHQ7N_17140 [Candidatus Methylomirabilales bacterium]
MRPDPSDHPLHQRAEAYTVAAHSFITGFRRRVVCDGEVLEERAKVVDPERAASAYGTILDAYEFISWYHTLIPPKIRRALYSKMEAEEDEDEEGWSLHWRDALGSARVARHGVVRSMAALRDAYDWDKGLEDQLVPLLADLD